ncbi:MAG TPA: HNH endonuclease signature motif containing protein [Anaeromyxobacter sp.]|nr:HNH endonuclease signature motif containing protein [Anaeromyxobacter sp.]
MVGHQSLSETRAIMINMTIDAIRDLSARLADLLRRERSALADFLVALADFDRQRAWRELGYASLFDYLHRELGLAKGTAFYRKTAAELIQRFPEVIEPLREGKLCITSIVELARVMTDENRAEVLPRFFHCSKREAQVVSAEIAPRAEVPVREVVTAVPVVKPAATEEVVRAVETGSQPVQPLNQTASDGWDLAAMSGSAPRPAIASPLTAELSRLHLTVSRELLEKLEAARLALGHSRPGASLADVLEAGADLVLARHAKAKALVAKPRTSEAARVPAPGASYIPAAVRREVWRRDGGCCQWPLASGGICGSRVRVEFDHVVPRGRGGSSTVGNVRLLCRVHNDLAARIAYGEDHMDSFTGGQQGAEPSARGSRGRRCGPYGVPLAEVDTPRVDKRGADRVEGCS